MKAMGREPLLLETAMSTAIPSLRESQRSSVQICASVLPCVSRRNAWLRCMSVSISSAGDSVWCCLETDPVTTFWRQSAMSWQTHMPSLQSTGWLGRLGSWVSPIIYAVLYTTHRKVNSSYLVSVKAKYIRRSRTLCKQTFTLFDPRPKMLSSAHVATPKHTSLRAGLHSPRWSALRLSCAHEGSGFTVWLLLQEPMSLM